MPRGKVLTDRDRALIEAARKGHDIQAFRMVKIVEDAIEKAVAEGRLTREEAEADPEGAIMRAHAHLAVGEYPSSVLALRELTGARGPGAEDNGGWWYKLSEAWMACGDLEKSRDAAERAVRLEPDFPWSWLAVAKLRAHFGDEAGAMRAVRAGLALVPGDPEFTRLEGEIEAKAPVEKMEYHFIDPDTDSDLLRGTMPVDERLQRLYAVNCIRPDERRLAWNLGVLGAMGLKDWVPAAPPLRPFSCATLLREGFEPLTVRFLMNEAGFSKIGSIWLERMLAVLPDAPEMHRAERVDVLQNRHLHIVFTDDEGREARADIDLSPLGGDESALARRTLEFIEKNGPDADVLSPEDAAALPALAELEDRHDWKAVTESLIAFFQNQDHPPSPFLSGEIAVAFNNLSTPGNAANCALALVALESARERYSETYSWNIRMGHALVTLNREGEAVEYLDAALAADPMSLEALELMHRALGALTLSRFTFCFAERIEGVWELFSKHEAELRERLRTDPVEALDDIRRIFELVSAGWWIDASLPKRGRKCRLVFSPAKNPAFIHPICMLADAMPESVRKNWRIFKGRQPGGVGESGERHQTLIDREEKLRVLPLPEEGRIRLNFHSDEFEGVYSPEAADPYCEALKEIAERTLGEAVTMKCLASVAVCPPGSDPAGTIPLGELPQWFDEHVSGVRGLRLEDLLSDRLEYFVKPIDSPVPMSDITSGWSTAVEFLNRFRSGDDTLVNTLARSGLGAGFVTLVPAELPENPEEAEEHMKRLMSGIRKLVAHELAGAAFVSGEALAAGRAYMEFIVLDPMRLFRALAAWAGEQPAVGSLSWRSWHSRAGDLGLK
ncbi:hypothetical protein [Sutterella sp.]|uniref:tetratricopeptide repeat protein n=1 Tax=Sutterella sp. TaxID=1981025 RepID=UPI0026DF1581|nr:hypothetical protein [Sutterella sp.]MDO5532954.1 hypothetical protein [Sutterella sp.]